MKGLDLKKELKIIINSLQSAENMSSDLNKGYLQKMQNRKKDLTRFIKQESQVVD